MRDRHHPTMPARIVLAALACWAALGCATQQPAPVPVAPRALVISAQRGQNQSRQDRDKADCQSIASSRASSSEGWAQMFTGCMTGRGYLVE